MISFLSNAKQSKFIIREHSATSNCLKYKQLRVKNGKIDAREMGETAEKLALEGVERMYKDTGQLRIEDFVFPYGELNPENDWVKLAALVPWDVAEERYAAQFANNRHPDHPVRIALGALLI